MGRLNIRALRHDDGPIAADIFFDAVQNGTDKHYAKYERDAWSGPAPDPDQWTGLLKDLGGYVAELTGKPVGFMTLSPSGYIDFAFVRSDAAGQGIGQLLYNRIESDAVQRGCKAVDADVSKAARPFFERNGWRVIREETVVRRETLLTRYRMTKAL